MSDHFALEYAWNDEAGYGPMKIDAVCHGELRQAFEMLGLADLLH